MARGFVVRDAIVSAALLGQALTAQAQTEAERWTLSLSARESLSDNLFVAAGGGPGDSITGATVSLAYGRVGPGSSLSALGWLNGSLFNRFSGFNGVQFGLAASGRVSLAPRAQLELRGAFADGLNSETLFASRIVIPQVDVKSASGGAGLTYALGANTKANATFDGVYVRYRSDQLVDTSKLPADTLIAPDVVAALRPPSPAAQLPLAPDESLDVLRLLAAEGLQTFNLDYGSWHAGAGITHGFSERTRVSATFGYRQTYENPKVFGQGDQVEAQAALREALGSVSNVALSYAYQDNRFQIRSQTHAFSLQGDTHIGSKARIDGSLGASYLDGSNAASSNWTLIGGGGLSIRLKRSSISARYTRSRYQGMIVGRSQVGNLVTTGIAHTITHWAFASAYALYRDAQDEFDPRFAYDEILVGASLNVRIKQRSNAGLSYSFLRFHSRAFPVADESVLSLFLGYARSMK